MCLSLGCSDKKKDGMQETCAAFIPPNSLPPGWLMLPTSEMPPVDKTPWWVRNPQLLEGDATRQIDIDGQPTAASKIWAVIYGKELERVFITCFIYPSEKEASTEYLAILKDASPTETLPGMLKDQRDTIVIMQLPPDFPDREFFVQHFESVVKP
jgi:hypothetical protein